MTIGIRDLGLIDGKLAAAAASTFMESASFEL